MSKDSKVAERARAAIEFLESVINDRAILAGLSQEEKRRLLDAAAQVYHPDTKARRLLVKATVRERKRAKVREEEETLGKTGIRTLRRQTVFTTPNVFPPIAAGDETIVTLSEAKGRDDADVSPSGAAGLSAAKERGRDGVGEHNCYICKRDYTAIHHFYDQLCPECARFNFAKRTELADLSGRTALLTGGRVKIGYQAGLKLLRCGARLIVTTRFPRDSAARYAVEADFEEWGGRLEIYGLDLRHTPSVEAFCAMLLERNQPLDFIISNACQTVRRPPAFYRHMMARESGALGALPKPAERLLGSGLLAVQGAPLSAQLTQLALLPEDRDAAESLFPEGRLDQDLQQVDLRGRNSWRLLLDEVSSVELLEVHLVNAVAPFVLNARLKPLMLLTPTRDKHIVNVSAVEGQFYRKFKTTKHPHTNMAKAALNMMTRTSATDYYHSGIHMNSVDTGWVTDEDPEELAAKKTAEHRFHPPLDILDGAARIVDPIISGFNTGHHVWGQFLKDYKPTDW